MSQTFPLSERMEKTNSLLLTFFYNIALHMSILLEILNGRCFFVRRAVVGVDRGRKEACRIIALCARSARDREALQASAAGLSLYVHYS